MNGHADVLVVGGAVGGVRTAETLRRHGFEGSITVLEASDELPCNRPLLSKAVLAGSTDSDAAVLRTETQLAEAGIELRRHCRAVGLELQHRAVAVDGDGTWTFGELIVATGSSPRRLRSVDDHPGIHHLRTMEDALHLRARLRAGGHLVVVGAGFVGSEVAAVAAVHGAGVTLVEPFDAPLAGVLGSRIGDRMARIHDTHGVHGAYGRTVTAITEGPDTRLQVSLDDGTDLVCDDVVVGIGAIPNTAWLERSGLVLDDGVVVGADCRAEGHPVHAVGDVARLHHPLLDASVRIEHWTNALEQAGVVAWNVCNPDSPKEHVSIPYVWSEQYDHRLQIVGRPRPDDHVEVIEDDDRRMLALFVRDERVSGAFGLNTPREMLAVRRAMATRAGPDEILPTVTSAA